MKELGYDHSAFSNEQIDLGHCSYKGLLTSQRERWLDVTHSQMKNTLRTPAAGVKGLNLNVIMQPHPTPDFQDVQRGKENATGLHRGAIDKLWEALQDNDLVSSTDTREKKEMPRSYRWKEQLQQSGGSCLNLPSTSKPSTHPSTSVPTPIKVLVSRYPWAQQKHRPYVGVPAAASQVRAVLSHLAPHPRFIFRVIYYFTHMGPELPATSLHRTSCSLYPNTWTVFRVKLPFYKPQSLSFPVNKHLKGWKMPAPHPGREAPG